MSPEAAAAALRVGPDEVRVADHHRLAEPVKAAIAAALRAVDVTPAFCAEEPTTLVVPRYAGADDLAGLLGRCLRPSGRRARALDRVRARARRRDYPEPLDADAVVAQGHALADRIEARRGPLLRLLTGYETHVVARDETARTLDLLRSLEENRACFARRIGEVASFLPCNQPLYALACFGVVPALMARAVHVRAPRVCRGLIDALLEELDAGTALPHLRPSRAERAAFLAERSALRADATGRPAPVTDAVIFTGTAQNAARVRRRLHPDVLVIVNGAGHNPLVVTEGADLERAVESALRVQLYNQGQDCASPSAILVHAAVHDAFVERLRARLREVVVGPYRDPRVTVGPLSRRAQLKRIQAVLVDHAAWLDPAAGGVVRTAEGIVEPTLILKPLAAGGNFKEHFAPLFFVQRYAEDAALAEYFEDPRYPEHAMYVTVFGRSGYVDGLPRRRFAGRRLHDADTILRDTDLHAPGVERGTRPYGGYGAGASCLYLGGVATPRPTLPQRDLFEQLVRPTLDARPSSVPPRSPSTAERLAALERRYLDPGIAPLASADTRVEPLVDGAAYFGAVLEALARARGPGDAVYLQAFQLDPDWVIPGAARPLGALLAEQAAAGVDVRVVLNGTPTPFSPWRESRAAARRLRRWRVGGARPLARRVRLDQRGVSYFGSHHQKQVLVRDGPQVVAFVSGMDPIPDHWDALPHGGKTWPDGSVWGWHDVGVRVRGAAVASVWAGFAERWGASAGRGELPPLPPCPAAPVVAAQAVQVLRSAFRWDEAERVHELWAGMRRAIRAAERYVYIEDQYLCDRSGEARGVPLPATLLPVPERFSLYADLAERMAERPELKVVLLGSGKSDPADFQPGPRNRVLTPSLRRLRDRLPRSRWGNLAVWRLEQVTVHSKLVLIDDAWAAVGSGNFWTRSFTGFDDELQVAWVSADDAIRDLRVALWAEHLGLLPIEAPLLRDPARALRRWGFGAPASPTGGLVPVWVGGPVATP